MRLVIINQQAVLGQSTGFLLKYLQKNGLFVKYPYLVHKDRELNDSKK